MKLTHLEIHEKLKTLAQRERELSLEVLEQLRIVYDREIYAELGYSSLFLYCTKELGYSDGAAFRRIESMKLLIAAPAAAEKVRSGEITLSHLAQIQQFTVHEKINDHVRKMDLVQQMCGKSTRETKFELAKQSSRPELMETEKITPLANGLVKLELVITQEMLEEIENLKSMLSHVLEKQDLRSVIRHAVKSCLKGPKPRSITSAPKSDSDSARSISRSLRRRIWERDGGRCTFRSGSRICGSKYFLQIDHIIPVSEGGKATFENLRLYCFRHNQWRLRPQQGFDRSAA